MRKIESRRTRSNHSSRSSSKEAPAAVDLAEVTTIHPGFKSGRANRKISRSLRRTRFLTTAPPTFLEVTIPIRVGSAVEADFKADTRIRGP